MKNRCLLLTLAVSLALTLPARAYIAVTVPSSTLYNQLCSGCTVNLVQSTTAPFGLFGQTSGPGTTGMLICSVYQGTGDAGKPFYVYEYAINANLLGPAAGHCLGFDVLDLGAYTLSWDLDGSGALEQIFSLSDTTGGGVPVFLALPFGSDLRFYFGNFGNYCGLKPGSSSLVFGFVSHDPPGSIQAEVVDTYTDPISGKAIDYPAVVPALGPSIPALPPIINPFLLLQGLLTGTNIGLNPNPSGMFSMQFQLFDSPTNGNPVSGVLTQVENVVNGLFTANLDFGENSFHPPSPCFVDVAIAPIGTASPVHLMPRLPLGLSPYAAHAFLADGVANLGAGQAVTSLNGMQDKVMLVPGTNVLITPTNNALILSATGVLPGSITATDLGTPVPGMDGQVLAYSNGIIQWQNACACPVDWHLSGNAGTTPGLNFVGTTDNQPLDLDSFSHRGLQLQYVSHGNIGPPATTSFSINVLGGYWGNIIANNVAGGTIAGGGELSSGVSGGTSVPNVVTADFGTVGGGLGNAAGGNSSIIGGGYINTNNADSSTIGGGFQNLIDLSQTGSTIAGGVMNVIHTNASYSAIGGGFQNVIQTNATQGTIAGGYQNTILQELSATAGFIGGGYRNTIGGGLGDIFVDYGVIAGGDQNAIPSGNYCFVGGGSLNQAGGGSSTAPGGSADYATVGGGLQNSASGGYSTVPGGFKNLAAGSASFAAGSEAQALHNSSFVWSDGSTPTYSSDYPQQFKIRASRGVVMDVSKSVGLNPAALWVNSTSTNGVGIYVSQSSTDATAVFANSGTGDIIKGFGSSGPQPNFELKSNGGVTFQGFGGSVSWNPGQCSWSFVCPSDRNLKENIIPVDPETVLQKIVKMPVSAWSYKGDPQRHIGPMAQDFYSAFATGQDDKHISPLDEQGVALAAIKALNQNLEEKDDEIRSLKQRIAGLEEQMDVRLAALERAVGNAEANAAPPSIKTADHTAALSDGDE